MLLITLSCTIGCMGYNFRVCILQKKLINVKKTKNRFNLQLWSEFLQNLKSVICELIVSRGLKQTPPQPPRFVGLDTNMVPDNREHLQRCCENLDHTILEHIMVDRIEGKIIERENVPSWLSSGKLMNYSSESKHFLRLLSKNVLEFHFQQQVMSSDYLQEYRNHHTNTSLWTSCQTWAFPGFSWVTNRDRPHGEPHRLPATGRVCSRCSSRDINREQTALPEVCFNPD